MRLFVRHPSWTTRKKRAPLRTTIDLSAFLSVMLVLLFILMFGNLGPTHFHHSPVDMPVTQHSTMQPDAEGDDAVIVTITRDGSLYLMNARVTPADIPPQLRDLMGSREDKTVYVKADARAKYGDVKIALDSIRAANAINIVFLTGYAAPSKFPL